MMRRWCCFIAPPRLLLVAAVALLMLFPPLWCARRDVMRRISEAGQRGRRREVLRMSQVASSRLALPRSIYSGYHHSLASGVDLSSNGGAKTRRKIFD
ncbi:hypothetical protein E2C01_060975 [Portunus trituberculatus]|uniref:Uncharacterized protein n=1 Tax=Portunus trituberculatus TaxID=210409 RepID=A0A5B7H6X0_PORTR|nr:hypothetical protein [Portunus trituberculatus]